MDAIRSKALHQVMHFYKYDGSWLADSPKPALPGREAGFTLSRAHAHDVSHDHKAIIKLMCFSVFLTTRQSSEYQSHVANA